MTEAKINAAGTFGPDIIIFVLPNKAAISPLKTDENMPAIIPAPTNSGPSGAKAIIP